MGSPASPTAALISTTGISAPTFAAILAYLQSQYGSIFGSDAVLTPYTQDGQLLGIAALAMSDANAAAIAAYQSFSPVTAQGAALSCNVAINGIPRQVPSNSTVSVQLVGVAGTVVTNCVLIDSGNNRWDLPASVTIGSGGTATTSATCETEGAVTAAAGAVTIANPPLGLQTASFTAAATPGQPVQTDAELRQLQAASTMLPSLSVMDGLVGALLNLTGVTAVQAYINETSSTDSNGVPAGALAIVVAGGDFTSIASIIALKKTPGIQTYGTLSESVTVSWNTNPQTIHFTAAQPKTIAVTINLTPGNGYNSVIGTEIQNAVSACISSLPISSTIMIPRLYVPAQLMGPFGTAAAASASDGLTYEIAEIEIAMGGGSFGSTDVTVPWYTYPDCIPTDVIINT